jgi:adhesin/invasin
VDQGSFVGPNEDINKYIFFKRFVANEDQLFVDSSTTVIVELQRVNKDTTVLEPADNIAVTFSAVLGTITESDTTDSLGMAIVDYHADSLAGLDEVVVTAGEKADTLYILILNPLATVSLSSDTTAIIADGRANVRVKAKVVDEQQQPMQNVLVFFSVDEGSIVSQGRTNEGGITYATLTGVADSNNVVATVKASLTPFANLNLYLHTGLTQITSEGQSNNQFEISPFNYVHKSREVKEKEIRKAEAKQTRITELRTNNIRLQKSLVEDSVDSLLIIYKGIKAQLHFDRNELLADGVDSTLVTVLVFESNSGIPLKNYPFQVTASRGVISGNFITDDNGRAVLVLRSSFIPGNATVTITLGTDLPFTAGIPFVSSHPNSLSMNSSSTSLLADGVTSSTLTALILDTLSNPVPGVEVLFQTAMGTLSENSAITDENGEATVTHISPASVRDTSGYVICQVSSNLTESSFHGQMVVRTLVSKLPMKSSHPFQGLKRITPLNVQGLALGDEIINTLQKSNMTSTLVDSIFFEYRGVTINLSTQEAILPADGNSTTLITTTIYETTAHSPITGANVYFSTTNGTITGSATSDASGVANAVLNSSNIPGIATIVATFGTTLKDTVFVEFYSLEPTQVSLSSVSSVLLADGRDTTQITALVTDAQGNSVSSTEVVFNTSIGTLLTSTVVSDSNGAAVTSLVSSASYTNIAGEVDVSLSAFPAIRDTMDLIFQGITINSTAADQYIIADGQSSTTVDVLVRESGTNVAIPNESVAFATTLGTITGPTTTDANGHASAVITSGTIPGLDTVFIMVGQTLYDTVTLSFLSPDPQNLVLTTDTTTILGDGLSNLTISATVTDTLGDPISGVQVVFNSTLGDLAQSTTTTDNDGIATNALVSSARFTDTTVVITAAVADFPTIQDNVIVTFRGITFTVNAQDSILLADGNSTTQISAQLKETSNGHPLANRTVFWSTNLGTIPGSTITDNNGNTTVTLTTGTTAGTALIQGSFGNTLTASTSVLFLAPSDSSIVLSWYNPPGTGDGNGDGTDDLQVSAIFTDQNGLPIVGADIQFSLNPSTMGTIISPATTDNFGTATTTLRYSSQYIGSTVRVTAVNGSAMGYIDIVLPDLN